MPTIIASKAIDRKKIRAVFDNKQLIWPKMQNDTEQLCASGLDGSRPSSAPATAEESLETMTLQAGRVPLKRKSDDELGSDPKRRPVTEETPCSEEASATLAPNDVTENTGTEEENRDGGKDEPFEQERRVIISMYFVYFSLHHINNNALKDDALNLRESLDPE